MYGQQFDLSVPYRIAGVVEDVKLQAFTDAVRPMIYRTYGTTYHFIVKTTGDASALMPAARQAIADVDPQLVVTSMTPLGALVFRDAITIIVLGLLVGLPAAFAAVQVTQSLLYGVTPASPHVFVATGGVLAFVALGAVFSLRDSIMLSVKYNNAMDPSSFARELGRLGGRSRARRLTSADKSRIASLGGHARRESHQAARRIADNFQYLAVVEELHPPPPVKRLRTCRTRLPGLCRST